MTTGTGTVNQPWYKSWTLWLAIAGQVLAFFTLLGAINTEQNDALFTLLVALGEVLTLVGLVNNPTKNHIAAYKLKHAHE